jgi:hypothetical protein
MASWYTRFWDVCTVINCILNLNLLLSVLVLIIISLCAYRLSRNTRIQYCKLIIALQEGDVKSGISALKELGYVNNQTDRAPERDFEFFEFLLRDSTVSIKYCIIYHIFT